MVRKNIFFMLVLIITLCTMSVAFAGVNAVTPSTNDDNRNMGWAHVDQVAIGFGYTDLEFISTRDNKPVNLQGFKPGSKFCDAGWCEVALVGIGKILKHRVRLSKTQRVGNGMPFVKMVYKSYCATHNFK